jgi:hypothetical protein
VRRKIGQAVKGSAMEVDGADDWEANAVCDRLGLTDEHERGVKRMFVNMMIISDVAVVVDYVGWRMFT